MQAQLNARSRSEIGGEISVDKLSLPWLTAALALNVPGDPTATSIWSTAKFGQSGRLVSGGRWCSAPERSILGRGLQGTRASFTLEAQSDGISIRNLETGIGNGRMTGSTTITRQGEMATVVGEGALQDVPLWALGGASPFEATLSGSLRFARRANVSGAGLSPGRCRRLARDETACSVGGPFRVRQGAQARLG